MSGRTKELDAARARVREAGGDELLERLDHLDALRSERGSARHAPPPKVPAGSDAVDTDVVLAGGGLWSLLAPLLADRGLRVTVLERARAGQSHREWNASGPELRALVRAGLFDEAELERMVLARYDFGTCRFHRGPAYPVHGVLDHAVDAGTLLAEARALGERRGVRYFDQHAVVASSANERGVRVRAACGKQTLEWTARVMVDARGVASPFASADLSCPTVGGVLEGLEEGDGRDQTNPRVGEILATVDGVDDQGRQHVWEAFPGRPGETTVYLFYYARANELPSLVALYARFFRELSSYKRGDARLVRPTFGFIPGWSRLVPAPRSPSPRIVLVGDAAARHSPLTYCGFGATLRSLDRTADVVVRRASGAGAGAVDDAPIHRMTGALAQMMASRAFVGEELNELLDAAFKTLHSLGEKTYAELLRDEMPVVDFVRFLRLTAARHPRVWGEVMRGLGPWVAGRWGLGLARELLHASS